MSNRRRRTGFSLLELTLAMSIAAMLAVTLYTAMAAAVKARRSINNAIEPTRAVNIAGEMITEDFKNVPQLHAGGLADSFEAVHQTGLPGGDNDTVQFYTIGSDATGSATDDTSPLLEGIRRVELAVKTDVNPPVLVRRVTRNLLAPTLPVPEEEILCTGVRAFSLRYFDGSVWQTDWDSTQLGDVLPFAVQIVLDLDDPNAQSSGTTNSTPAIRHTEKIITLPCGKFATTGGG
jgi:prepilin-type N-terminal cleavage/methylation domain-containing protein